MLGADRPMMPKAARPSRRRVGQIVRRAVLDSYGVRRVSGARWYDPLLAVLRLGTPGVAVQTDNGLTVEVHLSLARGVPATAVASNVEERVRYVIQRELDRAIDRLILFVDGRPLATDPAGGGARRGHR